MLSLATIFKCKLALIRDAEAHGYLVDGTRAYMRGPGGKLLAIMGMGTYARRTLEEYQRRHHLNPSGILDAPTRASLLGAAPAPSGPLRGVDVSNYQPNVNYAALKADGVRFGIAKASEGRTFVDQTYVAHRAGFTNAGMLFGAYHFARPNTRWAVADAQAQARLFLDVAKPKVGDLFPALDVETGNGDLTAWVQAFVNEVKAACGNCIIYGSPAFLDAHLAHSFGCPLWLADYTTGKLWIPKAWEGHDQVIWQFTALGREPGQSGELDLDRSTGSLDALRIAG